METPTAVKPASTMKATAAVEFATTVESTSVSATEAASAFKSTSTVVSMTVKAAPVKATTVIAPAIVAVRTAVIAVEPWSGTDKGAAYEPVRSVVTIRSAGVRSVSIISIRADWSRPNIAWTDSHTDHHALRVGIGGAEQTNYNQTKKPQISHWGPPFETHKTLLNCPEFHIRGYL